MKWLLCLGLVIFPVGLFGQPAVPQKINATISLVAPTKQIKFKVSWTQSQQVDSTMMLVFLSSDTVPVVYRRGISPDTVVFTIPDDTTTYRFMLVNVRRGLVSLPANANFYFNADQYYQVTQMQIRPKDLIMEVGDKIQLCPFFQYSDGTIVIRDRDKDKPTCVTEYNKFDETLRKSVGARLRNANKECLEWTILGGQSQKEICSPIL